MTVDIKFNVKVETQDDMDEYLRIMKIFLKETSESPIIEKYEAKYNHND